MILLPLIGLLMLAMNMPTSPNDTKLRGQVERIGEFTVRSKEHVAEKKVLPPERQREDERVLMEVQDQEEMIEAKDLDTFSCDGDRTQISMSYVDDDYCDCEDGSDEPNTSACSMYASSRFECKSAHIELGRQILYASRMDDGVCDCCDGSDEPSITCPNRCTQTIPKSPPPTVKGHNRRKRGGKVNLKWPKVRLSSTRRHGPVGTMK
jgi:hypothetical protein